MLGGNYPKVGQSGPGHQRYVLDVCDFLQVMEPPEGFDLEPLDPVRYFITSGDAIQKTDHLIKVLWRYAGTARRQLSSFEEPTDEQIEFEAECWRQAGAARRMRNALLDIKADNVFLETEWREHKICVLPKNPRAKKAEF